MTRLRVVLSRLGALVRSRQMDREFDDEITSHLAEATRSTSGRAFPRRRRAGPRSGVSVA